MISFFAEHRLIHRTSTVKYNARTAEANAIVQDEERKQSLLREVGNASITADANQKSMLSQQAKIIGATTPQEQAELEAARQRLGESQAVYKNQADGKQSEYNTETGKITAMGAVEQSRRERLKDQPMGEIEQSKYARLDKANATPEQRKTNEANLQGIMNYTDTSTLEPITNAGVVETPQQFEERKAFIEKQNTEKATQDEIKRKKQEDIAAAGAASTAAGSKALERSKENPAPINDTAKMDRVSTMIDGIIGASGDPMGPVYKEMMMQDFQDMEDAKANAALSRDASFARAEEQDNDVQTLIDKYTKIHRENNEAYTKLLDETRDSQQKYLAEQEQRDKAKLAWDADMETQKLTKQKTQQLLSQSIQNALGGGAFSGAANEQLAATEREWDTAISNLAAEFSFKEADVSAFYTQKYVDTNNQFNMDVFNAAKMLDEKIEGYALQGFNSLQARKTAETEAQNQYRTDITNAKTKYTEAIKGYVKEMQTTYYQSKDEKRAQEQTGYQRLNWAIDTYGVNVPKALVDEISKSLPNVDVQSIISTPTAAALKASRSGGSGSNLSFPAYMQKPGGEPPSFESFLAEKEKQALAAGANSFDTSPAAMAAYQKEYDTRTAATKQYNPTDILRRFTLKAGTLTGPSRNYAEDQLKAALDAGDYEFASQIVDNTGDDIPAQQANDFTQALNSRYNVKKMESLFDEIGTTYPVLGKIRELNPLDDRVVQYKQNLTQTIPGLARGIFKEVGVLTDSDIERYTSAMANPNLTVAQAQNAFNDLKERIDVSIQNQINVWDAGKKAVGGFRELYKAEPINAATAASPTLSASQDYAQQLLLSK